MSKDFENYMQMQEEMINSSLEDISNSYVGRFKFAKILIKQLKWIWNYIFGLLKTIDGIKQEIEIYKEILNKKEEQLIELSKFSQNKRPEPQQSSSPYFRLTDGLYNVVNGEQEEEQEEEFDMDDIEKQYQEIKDNTN